VSWTSCDLKPTWHLSTLGYLAGRLAYQSKRPVISTQAVPKERVRLDTATVTEQRQVSDQLRKEQINAEGVDAGRHSR
jgi:stress response protein YsnF